MGDTTEHFLLLKSIAVLRMKVDAVATRKFSAVHLSRVDAMRILETLDDLMHRPESTAPVIEFTLPSGTATVALPCGVRRPEVQFLGRMVEGYGNLMCDAPSPPSSSSPESPR